MMTDPVNRLSTQASATDIAAPRKQSIPDSSLLQLLVSELEGMGIFEEEYGSVEEWKERWGVLPLYGRWLEETLLVLEEEGYVSKEGEGYRVRGGRSRAREVVWSEWEEQKRRWVEEGEAAEVQVELVETTLRALGEMVRGKRRATDVLFPQSSLELVEGAYKENVVAKYCNQRLAETLVGYVKAREKDGGGKVRILEIGAGTGGSTAVVLEQMAGYEEQIEEYCYTDISQAFLEHGEKAYARGRRYLRFRKLDVERGLAGQGIEVGGYDVVIAANVLHATKNIRVTVRNAKAALKKNGLLVLNEITEKSLLLHLTFGLLEGWWLYEDERIRMRGCPGLSVGNWERVLKEEGFCRVWLAAMGGRELGQEIIVGESDGVIRQVRGGEKKRKEKAGGAGAPGRGVGKEQAGKRAEACGGVREAMMEEHVRQVIVEKLAETLKVKADAIEVDDPFAEYGVDSIVGVQLVQLINDVLGTELSTTILFDHPTVGKLTREIVLTDDGRIAARITTSSEPTQEAAEATTSTRPENPLHPLPPAPQRPKNLRRHNTCPEVRGHSEVTEEQLMSMTEDEVEQLLVNALASE